MRTKAFGRGAPRRVRLPFGCVAPTRSSLPPGYEAYCSCSSRMDDIRLTKKPAVSSRDDGPADLPRYHSCCRRHLLEPLPAVPFSGPCRAAGGLSCPITGASRTGVLRARARRASFHRSAPRRVRVSLPLRRTDPQLSEAGRQPYCSCSRRLLKRINCWTLLYAVPNRMSTLNLKKSAWARSGSPRGRSSANAPWSPNDGRILA